MTSFVTLLIKWYYVYVFTLYLEKNHYLSLFKIDTLNFTMYILANLTCPLKTYVRLHNLISMNIFITMKNRTLIVKRKAKTNRLQKPFKKLSLM